MDAEQDELLDEGVFLEFEQAPPVADRLPARPTLVDCSAAIKPYQEEQRLLLLDKSAQDDPAAWVQRCPLHDRSDACCVIQRAGTRLLAVLDVQRPLPLRVPQLRCAVHGRDFPATSNDFIITTPMAYKQVREFGVVIQPRIECLTSSIVVTRGAYECASACAVHAWMRLHVRQPDVRRYIELSMQQYAIVRVLCDCTCDSYSTSTACASCVCILN